MTHPRFADPAVACRTLTLVTAEDCPALRDSHPAKDWLIATGFEAGLGELRLIPGETGVGSAIAGLGTAKARARLRFGIAKAVAGLPAGYWALVTVIIGFYFGGRMQLKAQNFQKSVQSAADRAPEVIANIKRLRTELSLELAQGLDIDNSALRDCAKRGRGLGAPGA